ncbi:S-adenosyl-L-methionine-dependent methyltransferase [Triangularia setosa]|uniref:S-adenosyl-L-methionine-dependent methyltransferase n=1 Tax=Triangularia setosa TaxID=2587417 RepID=A0AAN6WBI5_9PEZI|nr:S-adenosyl-L-methionine-dependent methyltransferase [Podospora setosa]
MALPSKQEVQDLVKQLTEVARNYDDSASLAGHLSRTEIIAKAKNLQRALITADQTPAYHGLNMAELIAARTFIKLGVLDAIPETGAISLEGLSRATGAQESLLERVARILVATGFLLQPSPTTLSYAHSKFSLVYRSGSPAGYFFLALYDQYFKHAYNFDDYLEAHDQLSAAREPDDPLHNPCTWNAKQDGVSVWQIMAQNPEKLAEFQKGLAGIDVAVPPVGHFDFSLLKNTEEENAAGIKELVDIGGGHGVVLSKILAAHPELSPKNTVLQERRDICQLAAQHLPEGAVAMEHDFTKEQPVKGAKGYFFRMIMHDYSDAVASEILKQIVPAMTSESRVLVCDMVLPQKVGEADFAAAVMDHAVMTMGGKERTEEGFRRIFDAAGLELVKIWRAPGVPGGLVEGRVRAN